MSSFSRNRMRLETGPAKHMFQIFKKADARGGGVHDLRMDGGLPPGFQKGTLF